MREMKDSGLGWLGKVPANWKVERLQWHLYEINVKNNPIRTTNVLSLTNKRGVIPYEEKGAQGNISKENYNEYHLAYKDTIVANSMNILIGSVGYSDYYGCVSPVYYVFKEKENNDLHFLNYIMQTTQFQKELRKYANGILEIRLRVSSDDILKRMIAVPGYGEQKKIAAYLDGQCKKIDEIMADIQSQIDTLEDYKKSVISETVTKGLDPDAAMKDSCVTHIDSIPSHWKTLKLKYALTLKGRIGWQGLRTEEYRDEGPYLVTGTDFNKGYINWNSCVHVSKERFEQDKNIQIQENDLLITKDGTIGKIAMAKECPAEVSLNSGVFIVRNNRKYKYIYKFFYYIILSKQFSLWFELAQHGNSTIKHLTQENFYEFIFAYPPIVEQTQIVNFLDDKCEKIDSIIENKKAQLETIETYKKSLIYEYVTGKKEVPENE